MTKDKNKTPRVLQEALASSCGTVITSLIMTPLDVVKIRLQAQTRQLPKSDGLNISVGRYSGSIDAFVKIIRYEGITSLWSGLPPTLAMTIPQVVLYFTAYEEAKKFFGYHEINNPNPLLPLASGAVSRIFAVTMVCPLELIRTKMQSEKLKYSEISEKVKSSVKNYGIRSLYRGLVATIWRDVPFSMIYWFILEKLKTKFLHERNIKKLDTSTTFFCGAVSGGVTAALTTPLDVVKTYRQVELGENVANKSPIKTITIIKQILKTKGVPGIFLGL